MCYGSAEMNRSPLRCQHHHQNSYPQEPCVAPCILLVAYVQTAEKKNMKKP